MFVDSLIEYQGPPQLYSPSSVEWLIQFEDGEQSLLSMCHYDDRSLTLT